MTKLIEAINNIVKLIGSLLSLGFILALLGGGFWAYERAKGILNFPSLSGVLDAKEPAPVQPVPEPDDPPGQTAIACYHTTRCGSADAHYDRIFFEDCAHTPFCADMYGHKQKFAEEVAAKCAHVPRCKTVGEHWLKFWPEWHLARKLKLQGNPLPVAMTTAPPAPAPKTEPPVVAPKEIKLSRAVCNHQPKCTGEKWECVARDEMVTCKHTPKCYTVTMYAANHEKELFPGCTHNPRCKYPLQHFMEYHLDLAYPPATVKWAQDALKEQGLR